MDPRNEGIRTEQGKEYPKAILLLYDMPEVCEEIRQELCGDSSSSIGLAKFFYSFCIIPLAKHGINCFR
jgi:hypothetical protein